MLFHVSWKFNDEREESIKRNLQIFQNWKPPAEVTFHGFYGLADGNGGVAIVETDSAAAMARTVSPFRPYLDFTVTPILPIEEAAEIGGEGIAFRDSIK